MVIAMLVLDGWPSIKVHSENRSDWVQWVGSVFSSLYQCNTKSPPTKDQCTPTYYYEVFMLNKYLLVK